MSSEACLHWQPEVLSVQSASLCVNTEAKSLASTETTEMARCLSRSA